MSLICLCITDVIEEKEKFFYMELLEQLASGYGCGVEFCFNWSEPIVENLKGEKYVFGLVDNRNSYNCEMLLLPDGWYYNGYTNDVRFRERMKLLADIAETLLGDGHCVEFYIGCSGMELEEAFDLEGKYCYFCDLLEKTVGTEGAEKGWHFIVLN